MMVEEALARLEEIANPETVKLKRERFGIVANQSLGIYQKDIKALAKEISLDNELALALMDTGIYEARLLCRQLYSYREVTEAQMESWVSTFENWEICNGLPEMP
ncbi:MAG: DNA alkylation repair protein [Cyanobacteria bacterium J06560_2]